MAGRQSVRSVSFALLALALAVCTASVAVVAAPATPGAGALMPLARNTVKLDSKDRIWQTNRVTAKPADQDAEEFMTGEGFLYAATVPVTVAVKREDDRNLEVGEAIPVENKTTMTVTSTTGVIGSFYTLELIDRLDQQNTDNRHTIGLPFSTTSDTYTMTLWQGEAAAGETIQLESGPMPGLLLVLDGTLQFQRTDGTTTIHQGGEAASQTGVFSLEAGEKGATFLVVTLTPGEGTPTA